MPSCDKKNKNYLNIPVAARPSPLSKAQVKEVLDEIRQHHPHINFAVKYLSTSGDKDQQTSLRGMDKTNFFTKEIDEELLMGRCRIGIHSAKDLPEPIIDGLSVICITRGVNPADSLVLKEGMSLNNLAKGALIGTSSVRREDMLKQIRSDFSFCDIRGTIGQRLDMLQTGAVDGVVIAEAALIRLNLTHLNRIQLPGKTTEGQGQLAILARKDDHIMSELFACMDIRWMK